MKEFKKGQLVNLVDHDNETEQMLIFKVIDDRDQDCLLCQATNSTLKYPPVEAFHHSKIEVWSPCMSDLDENGDINFDAAIHNAYPDIEVHANTPSVRVCFDDGTDWQGSFDDLQRILRAVHPQYK